MEGVSHYNAENSSNNHCNYDGCNRPAELVMHYRILDENSKPISESLQVHSCISHLLHMPNIGQSVSIDSIDFLVKK